MPVSPSSTALHHTLPPLESALIVGDVHGCADELSDLLAAVGDPKRTLVFVGDLVAKGPCPEGVLQQLRTLMGHAVRGNHDQHYLNFKGAFEREGAWPATRELDHLKRLGQEDWETLSALPHSLRFHVATDPEPTLIVHGGVVPGIPLSAQDPRFLMNLRSIKADGTPTSKIEGSPWIESWQGPGRVVFGHDALRKFQRGPAAFGLDTGCVYGGRLTGLLLPEEEIVSVPARRVHLEPG